MRGRCQLPSMSQSPSYRSTPMACCAKKAHFAHSSHAQSRPCASIGVNSTAGSHRPTVAAVGHGQVCLRPSSRFTSSRVLSDASEHSARGQGRATEPREQIASESRPNPVRRNTESPFTLAPIDAACLDFCIELLNQRTKVEDYESALICATAVLGRGEAGWRTAQSYPPILSKLIKIARFMVVHKAVKLDPTAENMLDELGAHRMAGEWEVESPLDTPDFTLTHASSDDCSSFDDTGPVPPAGPSSPLTQFRQVQRRTRRSFREWVAEMVGQFMVRGTNSPMQWLLDLRTYGLKIHYNSTTTGHVGWMNQD